MLGLGIAKGLAVTLNHFRKTYFGSGPSKGRGLFTVQYPEERLAPLARFRGSLAHLADPETGGPRCTACRICERTCPVGCISGIEGEGRGRERRATQYLYNIGECLFCGLCVEACPFEAIAMSHEYELATYSHDALVYDLRKLAEIGKKYALEGKEEA